MAGFKEIRTKIKSVESTRKITKAMEMVAVSKMRKAQERMRASRPYAERVRNIAGHLAEANPDYIHPFLVRHEAVRRAGLIVVTTDKGWRWWRSAARAPASSTASAPTSSRKWYSWAIRRTWSG
jgi:F-type H+-transporting ATPase subunit gamma